MPSPTTRAIEDYLSAQRDSQTRFLAELVKVPSDNPPGDCAPHGERTAALLTELGFKVERHPVPADVVRANGMISATNLIVRERFGPGPTIALNAHGDVVPPGLGWTSDPYGATIRDGYMYGRGVAVSKSDIATYSYALLALKASGAPLAGTVELHFTYDEEVGGGIGPAWILEQGLSRPDFALSAGFAYGITTAHNGCLHLEVEIVGRSAHAARPDTGVDALEAATGVLSELYAIRRSYATTKSKVDGIGAPTLTVGSDLRGHQYERRAGQGHVPDRPAHHPRGERGGRRSRADAADSGCGGKVARHHLQLSGGSCWPCRSCRFRGRKSWSRPSPVMRRPSWAKTSSRTACRSTRMLGSIRRPAYRPYSTAPGRTRCSKRTAIGPTRN